MHQALLRNDQTARQVLAGLGIAPATFYRWLRETEAPAPKACGVRCARPTPQEQAAVRAYAGAVDIKTRVAHPESNGIVERLHRTHREEAALDTDASYHKALNRFGSWSRYYNYERPHSALRQLCPFDYYRGNPEARQAVRRKKLADAKAVRIGYWKDDRP